MSRLRVLSIVVALALAAGACGIPLDDQPEVIAAGDLPSTLQPPEATSSTTTTTLPPQLTEDVTIYLVDPADGDPILVAVTRQVPIIDGAVDVERLALEQLLAGPTSEEQLEDNLTTLVVPSGDAPIEVLDMRRPAEDQLSVVLSESPAIEGGERVTSFAQMVFTLTEFQGVELVRFLVRDEAGADDFIVVKTDTEEGDVTRAVGRADYASLEPSTTSGA